jgi:hypothetical protein
MTTSGPVLDGARRPLAHGARALVPAAVLVTAGLLTAAVTDPTAGPSISRARAVEAAPAPAPATAVRSWSITDLTGTTPTRTAPARPASARPGRHLPPPAPITTDTTRRPTSAGATSTGVAARRPQPATTATGSANSTRPTTSTYTGGPMNPRPDCWACPHTSTSNTTAVPTR